MTGIIGKTHIGKRDTNEDYYAVEPAQGIAVVADGMGGAEAGEIAAKLATDRVMNALCDGASLPEAICDAHWLVVDAASQQQGRSGMGATIVAAKVRKHQYEIAWLGDSRAYLWCGELRQLSRDHSHVENLIRQGEITPDEALKHPKRNIITRALGHGDISPLDIPVVSGRLLRNQALLLCTDGLNDTLSGPEIAKILAAKAPAQKRLDFLVDYAVRKGGTDNITAVLVSAAANAPEADFNERPAAVSVAHSDGRVEYFPPY
jgi:PPM family protein phosphatase